jgi:hypothetical protein
MADGLFDEIAAYLARRRMTEPGGPYWGSCPVCVAPGETFYYDAGRNEWFVCEGCGVRWLFGRGHFSAWWELTAEEQAEQQRLLAGLRPVTPYFPPRAASASDTGT